MGGRQVPSRSSRNKKIVNSLQKLSKKRYQSFLIMSNLAQFPDFISNITSQASHIAGVILYLLMYNEKFAAYPDKIVTVKALSTSLACMRKCDDKTSFLLKK